jgi:Skp family chaperone for outer membrane proteins
MSTPRPNAPSRPLFLALTFAAAASLVLGLAPSLHAQDEGGAAKVVIGTYDTNQVAQATGLQEEMMQKMQGLRERAQEAQQAQDQAAMQQVQADAQRMQQEMTDAFRKRVEAVMPQVAETTGTQVIAAAVAYTAPGIETKDVTQAVIDAMKAE